jgi:hypothetical protein
VLEPLTTFDIFLHDETGQKKDITEYINSIVRSNWSMRKWDEEDKQQIIDTLSSKVNGMYVITCLVSCLELHNERSHGLVGFAGSFARLTGCVALFLRVFGRS